MFDPARTIELTGTVKAFQWTNPHAYIQLLVAKGDSVEEYSIELTSPNILRRAGWAPTTVKPGDVVTAVINPMRDGSAAGSLKKVQLPNGTVLGGQGRLEN